ncbi:MAG: hypothetical protein ACRD1T_22750, partial [Acidimicrobiia bacterium]
MMTERRDGMMRGDALALGFRGLLRRTRIRITEARFHGAYIELERQKAAQRADFAVLREDASDRYAQIRDCWIPHFVLEDWRAHAADLERCLLPQPRFDFLRLEPLLKTMVITLGGRVMRRQLNFLEDCYSEPELILLLEEDLVGGPVLMNRRYRTSHQAIHHLYHLGRFSTDLRLDRISLDGVTIEWGGGYGGIIKLLRRVDSSEATQIVIDLPIFALLQWLYLGTVFGPQHVKIATPEASQVEKGKINLFPLGLVDAIPSIA